MIQTLLTREQILQADDLPRVLVDVPEWGGSVYVRALNSTERDAYEASLLERRGKVYETIFDNARSKLCSLAMCDPDGKPLFTVSDVEALGRKSAAAMDRVYTAARRLSGLSDEDMEQLTTAATGPRKHNNQLAS